VAVGRIGKTKVEALYAGPNLRHVYNITLDREELWHNDGSGGNDPWHLHWIRPGRQRKESFIGPVQFVPAVLGVFLDLGWSANGDPAPAAGNFVAANQIHGGLDLTRLGAAADDWIAMHTGGNYPHTIADCLFAATLARQITDVTFIHVLAGLVGSSGLEIGDGNPWTVPDDGIWFELDTDVDTHGRIVTSNGGVQTVTDIGVVTTGLAEGFLRVGADGASILVTMNGNLVATHTTNLPTVQMKWIWMVQSRDVAARVFRLRDFNMMCQGI